MRFDPIDLTKELMNAHGLSVRIVEATYEDIDHFDEQLRKRLLRGYDYGGIIRKLEELCRDAVVYMTSDQFELHYFILKLPPRLSEKSGLLIIGPYMIIEYGKIIQEVMEENKLPLILLSELKDYYSGIPYFPITDALNSEVFILAKYIFDTDVFDVDRRSIAFAPIDNEPEIKKDSIDSFSLTVIEERYRNEEDFLAAIERGDIKKATVHLAAFSKYQLEQRCADHLRDSKNYLIALNSLSRKAVQRADVHPAHINSTSSYFVHLIEGARSNDELSKLTDEMIRKYCLLVKNHSLRSYSRPIQKALNYIDFNYTEQLSLEVLAQTASVNPSYLSTQFKKEVEVSVIDYVNQKRTQRAQFLLVTTNLPIHRVSEMVGFLDDTYFARTFKRYTEKAPREYRKLFKQ